MRPFNEEPDPWVLVEEGDYRPNETAPALLARIGDRTGSVLVLDDDKWRVWRVAA